LAPDPHDPAFPAYQQFLHLRETGLAASMYFVVVSCNLAPEGERANWGAARPLEVREPAWVGDPTTRALALSGGRPAHGRRHFGDLRPGVRQRTNGFVLGEAERAHVARNSGRKAYPRAMETYRAAKAWAAAVAGR
jgi:glutathione S-transferase